MRQLYSIIVVLLSFLGIVFMPVQWQFFYDLGQPAQSTPTSDLAQEVVTSTIQADSVFVKLMNVFLKKNKTDNIEYQGYNEPTQSDTC